MRRIKTIVKHSYICIGIDIDVCMEREMNVRRRRFSISWAKQTSKTCQKKYYGYVRTFPLLKQKRKFGKKKENMPIRGGGEGAVRV